MAKKTAEQILESKRDLAGEFISLMLPRLLNSISEDLQKTLDHLNSLRVMSIKETDTASVDDLIAKTKEKLDRILTGEPADKIREFYVEALVEEFTEEELQFAVLSERFNIKFNGLTARAESVLKEALGEE